MKTRKHLAPQFDLPLGDFALVGETQAAPEPAPAAPVRQAHPLLPCFRCQTCGRNLASSEEAAEAESCDECNPEDEPQPERIRGAGVMVPTDHEKSEWSRMARAAYADDWNATGHRFSAAASLESGRSIPLHQFDDLQAEYRSWLIGGFYRVVVFTCGHDFRAKLNPDGDVTKLETRRTSRDPWSVAARNLTEEESRALCDELDRLATLPHLR